MKKKVLITSLAGIMTLTMGFSLTELEICVFEEEENGCL